MFVSFLLAITCLRYTGHMLRPMSILPLSSHVRNIYHVFCFCTSCSCPNSSTRLHLKRRFSVQFVHIFTSIFAPGGFQTISTSEKGSDLGRIHFLQHTHSWQILIARRELLLIIIHNNCRAISLWYSQGTGHCTRKVYDNFCTLVVIDITELVHSLVFMYSGYLPFYTKGRI